MKLPMRDKVLIVDDLAVNRMILREILLDDYDIIEAESGEQALQELAQMETLPQAVLLDIIMPGMDGFEVLHRIKSTPFLTAIPVLFITAADAQDNESRGLREGAEDYISKPFNADVVKTRVDHQIQLAHYRSGLESVVRQKTEELMHTHETVLETLATIIEYRSLESGAHVRRTCELSKLLVTRMLEVPEYASQLVNHYPESLVKAVSLHDIGKVGIPDSILLKNGALTPEEYEVIKQHTTIGADIINQISTSVSDDAMYLYHCKNICRHHHERWDGKGYPDGLKGEEIPLSARIVAVVDVYDALVNKRCYKPAFSYDKALSIITEGAGTQFDPGVVALMESIEGEFRQIEREISDPT